MALEISQNNILRSICHANTCTPITSLQLVCKCLPIEFELFKHQLNYAKYLHELPNTRLVHQAYLIQTIVLKPLHTMAENYWLHAAEVFTTKIGLETVDS